MHTAPEPEFSRLIAVEGLTHDKTRHETVEATTAERAALAQRLDMRSLDSLSATVEIRRISNSKTVHVKGKLEAEGLLSCVVTLRDVPVQVSCGFETFFSEENHKVKEISFGADEDADSAEVLTDGMINIGEIVAQYLSLELPEYPRAPGVGLPAQMAENGTKDTHRPFEALAALKEK